MGWLCTVELTKATSRGGANYSLFLFVWTFTITYTRFNNAFITAKTLNYVIWLNVWCIILNYSLLSLFSLISNKKHLPIPPRPIWQPWLQRAAATVARLGGGESEGAFCLISVRITREENN